MKRLSFLKPVVLEVIVPLASDLLQPFAREALGITLEYSAEGFAVMRDGCERLRLLCLKHGTLLKKSHSDAVI
jgi:hypothetical protein